VLVAVAVALVALQAGTLLAVREPGGHGEDIRPALALARADGVAGLPIVLSSRTPAVELAAYARADERRLIGVRVQRTGARVWGARQPRALRDAALGEQPRLILLLRGSQAPGCGWRSRTRAELLVARCMPAYLRDQGYRVTAAQRAGYRWTFAVIARSEPVTIPAVAGR
jgi:hypothetical protein